jgi:hypothetical protein
MISNDTWYVSPTKPPRRTLAVNDTHVYYGRGGDAHYFCQKKTFERWIGCNAAVPVNKNET